MTEPAQDAMMSHYQRLSPRERDELQVIGMVWNNVQRSPRDAARIVEECLQAGLEAKHFARESHRTLWGWLVEAFQAGRPLGWETLTAGRKYPPQWNVEICDIIVNSPVAESAIFHANRIIAMSQAEVVAGKAQDFARAILSRDPDEPADVADMTGKAFDDMLAIKAVNPGRVIMIEESAMATLDEIEAAMIAKASGESRMIKTGLAAFDAKYGGLNKQGFHVLGARPGVGKTTVAINIALGAARSGSRVLFFTHEMGHTELTTKMISHGAGLPASIMRRGEIMGELDTAKFQRGTLAIRDLPMAIDDKSMPDWPMVERRIRQHAKSYKLALVVIDYIQQLTAAGENQKWISRVQELTHITSCIKSLSQELGIAILGCAQLNREAEKSTASTPTLSMLKDCGSLEQDADIVMFIHRGGDEDEPTQLIVEKHRHDEAGVSFPLDVQMAYSRVTTAGEGTRIMRRRKEKDSKFASSLNKV